MSKFEKLILGLVFGLMTIFGLVAFTHAAAPTDRAVDANWVLPVGSLGYESFTPTKLTVTGVGDTSTIASKWNPKVSGVDVILTRGKLKGTKSDSVGNRLIVDCLDSKFALLYSVEVDTIIDSLGEAIKLPLGSTCVGSYYNIRFVSAVAASSKSHQAGTDTLPSTFYIYYPKLKRITQ